MAQAFKVAALNKTKAADRSARSPPTIIEDRVL